MSRVHVESCPTYAGAVGAARTALDAVKADTLVKSGDSVILKVNLIRGDAPEKAINTHPEMVRAVGKYFKNLGCKVIVADSSGTFGFTTEGFRVSGITAVCEEEGFELLNFEKSKLEKMDVQGEILKELYVPKDLLDADLVVTMPKMKCHVLTLMTGSIKNMLGILPGDYKRRMHKIGKVPAVFAKVIVDIFGIRKPDLSVMDGVLAMEGNGPTGGTPRQFGHILVGHDCVAVDTVTSYLMGFKIEDLQIIVEAHRRGFGEMSLEKIETNIELDSIRQQFKKPLTLGLIGGAFSALPETLAKPVIGEDCEKCMICLEECPVDAIYADESGNLKINYDLCIKCYCCHEKCPSNKVQIVFGRLPGMVMRRRLKGYNLDNA